MQTNAKTYITTTPIAETYLHAIGNHNNGHTLTPVELAGLMAIEVSTARYLLDRVMALHHKIERDGGVGMVMSKDGTVRFMLAPNPDE